MRPALASAVCRVRVVYGRSANGREAADRLLSFVVAGSRERSEVGLLVISPRRPCSSVDQAIPARSVVDVDTNTEMVLKMELVLLDEFAF